jgi:hypothetical protein
MNEDQPEDAVEVAAPVMSRATTLLVITSLILSLATWGIYTAAYFGKAGDELELPLILFAFGNPILAIAGVVFTIRYIDIQAHRTWRIQFIGSIASAILAVVALLPLI